jgi:hypothetical protein
MLNLRTRLILAAIAVLGVAFAIGDFEIGRHSPQQSIRVASTENRDQTPARNSTSVREKTSVDGASVLGSVRGGARAVQRWGLETIWRVKHRLGM